MRRWIPLVEESTHKRLYPRGGYHSHVQIDASRNVRIGERERESYTRTYIHPSFSCRFHKRRIMPVRPTLSIKTSRAYHLAHYGCSGMKGARYDLYSSSLSLSLLVRTNRPRKINFITIFPNPLFFRVVETIVDIYANLGFHERK